MRPASGLDTVRTVPVPVGSRTLVFQPLHFHSLEQATPTLLDIEMDLLEFRGTNVMILIIQVPVVIICAI